MADPTRGDKAYAAALRMHQLSPNTMRKPERTDYDLADLGPEPVLDTSGNGMPVYRIPKQGTPSAPTRGTPSTADGTPVSPQLQAARDAAIAMVDAQFAEQVKAALAQQQAQQGQQGA